MQVYQAGSLSFKPPASITESYISLWNSDATRNGSGATASSGGSSFLGLGEAAPLQNNTASYPGEQLYQLGSNWNPTAKFAFEAALTGYSNGSNIAYAALWDMSSNTIVSGSQISMTPDSTYYYPNFYLVRSGSFTLVPGHFYGVTVWTSNSSYSAYITHVNLVCFGQ